MSALLATPESGADASGQQPVASRLPFEPGDSFAERYEIERQLGTGGMASVWLAYDRSLERRCALKILDADKATTQGACSRFHREARVAARIRSASVVNIFDHGEHRGLLYIAMEYLEGEDLASRIAREGKLDARQVSDVVAMVARGLTHAHTSGVIHRDIKPENIFLVRTDEGEIAKILDFGIATQVLSTVVDDSVTGLFLGTPMYASPEQVRGHDVDWRTDLWSLGVVAFECFTGRAPFTGETLQELCGNILTQSPPTFHDCDPAFPAALDAWLSRALSRDPEGRYQSAKELAEAFSDAVGYARISIPSLLPHSERFSDPGDAPFSVPPISAVVLPPPKPRGWRARLLAPFAAVVLIGGAFAGYQRGRAEVSHGGAKPEVTLAAAQPAETCAIPAAPPPKVAEAPVTVVEEPAPVEPARARKARVVAKPPPAPAAAKLEAWRRDPGF